MCYDPGGIGEELWGDIPMTIRVTEQKVTAESLWLLL
jgi:hypothetical protein